MKQEEIVTTLKEHYPRETRKLLVKSLIEQEDTMTEIEKENVYKTINQIFSFVLDQSGWEMGQNSKGWNDMPLKVMIETFPKLSTTKWYEEQLLTTNQAIDIQINE